jgi:hypothetical protein
VANIEKTKALMANLLRMKPKPHEDMKLGKKKTPKASVKRASSKTKSA